MTQVRFGSIIPIQLVKSFSEQECNYRGIAQTLLPAGTRFAINQPKDGPRDSFCIILDDQNELSMIPSLTIFEKIRKVVENLVSYQPTGLADARDEYFCYVLPIMGEIFKNFLDASGLPYYRVKLNSQGELFTEFNPKDFNIQPLSLEQLSAAIPEDELDAVAISYAQPAVEQHCRSKEILIRGYCEKEGLDPGNTDSSQADPPKFPLPMILPKNPLLH